MTTSERILITGGSGFIGRHLINKLIKHGYKQITVVDIVSPKARNVKFIKANYYDFNTTLDIIKNSDYVFHLAAMVGVDRCRLDPKSVRKVNNIFAKKFIKLCAKNGVKRFIFSSSSEVYGNSNRIPYKEEARVQPISEYAKSKAAVEKYLKSMTKKTHMTAGVVRLFNVYGPGQRKDFVISGFIDRALHNKSLIILGDGTQTRCFTFVDDAIEGIYRVFKYGSDYDIFNIGNSREYSINDLAAVILKKIPKSLSKIKHVEYGGGIREPSLEIRRRVPDVTKAISKLRFRAKITLRRGIEKYPLN